MNERMVREIADAVLYEGYMLYPYRASSVKNRQRWNFGVIYPRAYSEAQSGIDPYSTQTECLIAGTEAATLSVKVRFLQGVAKSIGELDPPLSVLPKDPESCVRLVPSLRLGEQLFQSWQEAVEREAVIAAYRVGWLAENSVQQSIALPAGKEIESVRDAQGRIAAVIARSQESIAGKVEVAAQSLRQGVYKVTIRVTNETPLADPQAACRELVLQQSLLSAHSILSVENGEFISLLETPSEFQELAAQCRNQGTWPVLVGEEGERDGMLSSPIILYDYPQIAPESPGNLFDGTEIDEILALRILTLTEEEKREMRDGDERARQILERTEALPPAHFMKLHGTLRGLRPSEDQQ